MQETSETSKTANGDLRMEVTREVTSLLNPKDSKIVDMMDRHTTMTGTTALTVIMITVEDMGETVAVALVIETTIMEDKITATRMIVEPHRLKNITKTIAGHHIADTTILGQTIIAIMNVIGTTVVATTIATKGTVILAILQGTMIASVHMTGETIDTTTEEDTETTEITTITSGIRGEAMGVLLMHIFSAFLLVR